MINPDQPRSTKLLFSKEELAPDDRSQATRTTGKKPKKVKPAQKLITKKARYLGPPISQLHRKTKPEQKLTKTKAR